MDNDAVIFLWAYLIILVLVTVVPILYYSFRPPYKFTDETRRLFDKLVREKEYEQATKVMTEAREARQSTSASRRITLATVVFVLLGLTLFYVLFIGDPAGSSGAVEAVLAMLSSLLSAIIGFYFGGRMAEKQIKKVGEITDAAKGLMPAEVQSLLRKVQSGAKLSKSEASLLDGFLR